MTISKENSKERITDAAKCPLCGNPNQCAMAADPNSTVCWCETVAFPDALLAKIPEDAVKKTCVCRKCLEEYQESVENSSEEKRS